MTGPSGNRLSICPLTSAAPRSIETLGEAILNLSGEIDLRITLETSHYLFNVVFIGQVIGLNRFIYTNLQSNIYLSNIRTQKGTFGLVSFKCNEVFTKNITTTLLQPTIRDAPFDIQSGGGGGAVIFPRDKLFFSLFEQQVIFLKSKLQQFLFF